MIIGTLLSKGIFVEFYKFSTFDISKGLSRAVMGTAKHRTPITMKINSPQLQLILTPELRILENYFKSNNFQLRFPAFYSLNCS